MERGKGEAPYRASRCHSVGEPWNVADGTYDRAYLADVFVRDYPDARNASNILGSFLGGWFPLLGQELDELIGIEWTYTAYGTIALAILMTARYLWRNGRYLNKNPTRRSEEPDLDPEELDEYELRGLGLL